MITVKRKYIIAATLIYSVLILIGSLLPEDELPDIRIPFLDKAIHFLQYCLLAIFVCFCLEGKSYRFFSGLILTIVYGIIMEFFQGLNLYRTFEYYDILFNILGAASGIILFKYKFYKTIKVHY